MHVPAVPRIGERDHAPRTRSRSLEERFHIRVTTDDAVECDDIGVRQGACDRGEVAEDELSGDGGVTRGEVAPRGLEISRRRVRERDAGQAGAGEFHRDHSNPTADVEEVEPLKRPAAEFREKDSRGSVWTAALIAAQITLRLLRIEVGGRSTWAGATRHSANLDGGEGNRYEC
jgi:hypothetical protein